MNSSVRPGFSLCTVGSPHQLNGSYKEMDFNRCPNQIKHTLSHKKIKKILKI